MDYILRISKLAVHTLKLFPRKSILAITTLILIGIVDTLSVVSLIPAIEYLSGTTDSSDFTKIINEYLTQMGFEKNLVVYFSVFGLIILIKSALRYFSKQLLLGIQVNLETHMGSLAVNRLLFSKGKYLDQLDEGKISNLLTAELNKVGECLFYIFDYLAVSLRLFFYFSVIFAFSGYLVLTIVITSLLTIIPSLLLNKVIYQTSHERITKSHQVTDYIFQLVKNIFEIKAYSAERFFSKNYHAKLFDYKKTHGKMLFQRELTSIIIEPLGVIQIIIIVYLCLNQFHLKFSETLIILFTLRNSLPLLAQLMNYKQVLISSIPSFEELQELIKSSETNVENHSGLAIDKLSTAIKINDLNFSYKDSSILKNINMTIQKGDSIAIVGKSGSGKSTLMKILMGINTTEAGNIIIDEVDLTKINISTWRNLIGFVPQEPILLKETLQNNIAIGEDQINQANLDNAVKKANLNGFINSLPEGLNTMIGSKGINVSIGQKQRISLARALYKNPEIIFLDEPTSSLDSESELFIKNTIQELKGKSTFIIIAHRLRTIKFCDKIFVMDDGRIIESGTYEDLIKLNGKFNSLVRAQDI